MWNFLKIDRLLTKSFTQNFKERYHHKRKESQVSNLKNCLPEEVPKEKSAKDMSLYESFNFSKGFIGVAKIASSLERLYGRIFLTEFGRTYFFGLFSRCRFFLSQRENLPRKNPAETQSMKIQVKSGEILVCKNFGKIMQNVDSPRLTPKSAKLAWYPILKTQ